ncbi:hypothetical protein [Streptomyces sp. NPDC017673]|uniref:hypothetical protein n=1 Tax=unclassified Streptomyces TaxID=2593676 RepID=UPI0037BD4C9A
MDRVTARRRSPVDEGAHDVFTTGRRPDALDAAVKQIGRNVTGGQGGSPSPGSPSPGSASGAHAG